jgi:hypothetical protein
MFDDLIGKAPNKTIDTDLEIALKMLTEIKDVFEKYGYQHVDTDMKKQIISYVNDDKVKFTVKVEDD